MLTHWGRSFSGRRWHVVPLGAHLRQTALCGKRLSIYWMLTTTPEAPPRACPACRELLFPAGRPLRTVVSVREYRGSIYYTLDTCGHYAASHPPCHVGQQRGCDQCPKL
jgi:hypothetical protein